jgi:hypothetical protein
MATTFYCGSLLGRNEKLLKNVGTSSKPRGGLKTAARALVK